MTRQNKQRLIDLKLNALKEQRPTFPEHALPKPTYTDKTANGLTKCIVDFLNLSGWQAERINTTGRFIVDKQKGIGALTPFGQTQSTSGKWIKGSGTKGSADISSTINGKSVKIEVKIGADRQSADQKAYQQAIQRAGGVYIIAKNFDDFIEWYDKFLSISKPI